MSSLKNFMTFMAVIGALLYAEASFAAIGTIPNRSYTSGELNRQLGPVISNNRPTHQAYVVNGYLFIGGNGIQEFYDIGNPYNPFRISEMLSPHRSGEAEGHQAGFAKYPDGNFYAATISGRGIDIWNITNPSSPFLERAVILENINYGDNTNAVWGIAWQGNYIYVGGTNTGLHIVDASNPSNPSVVRRVPTSAFCDVSAGPTFAMGNVLITGTPKDLSGIATLDISDPANPSLLDCERPSVASYITWFFGKSSFMINPLRQYDVLSNPSNITLMGSNNHPASEYMSFDEGKLLLGLVRFSRNSRGGAIVYNINNPNNLVEEASIAGRDIGETDDQFTLGIGNLISIGDEQGSYGTWLAPYKTQPDTRAPEVMHIEPKDRSINQPTASRIGISFDSQIELASLDNSSLIVRPVGGSQITGTWGYAGTVVTFWPSQPLQDDTTYEVILPAGGVTDLVGNALTSDVRTTFSTGSGISNGNACVINPLAAAPVGQPVFFSADNPNIVDYTYSWNFDDSGSASGTSVTHTYNSPGRYSVVLTAEPIRSAPAYEAENGTLTGVVVVASDNAGYSGSGFADFPTGTGSTVKVTWNVNVSATGTYNLEFRYANGGGSARPLNVVVNGGSQGTLNFGATSSWTTWSTDTRTGVTLNAGNNTIELVASAGSAGPNVDSLTIPGAASGNAVTCSATQVIHRALTVNSPTHSNSVLVDGAGGRVWAVNPDSNTVSAVSMSTNTKAFERNVGQTPRTLARAPDGTVWVVNQASDSISVLNASNGNPVTTINLPYGSSPYGIAFAPDGSAAYVTLEATGQLVRINPNTRGITGSLDLDSDVGGVTPKVRGVAVSADSRRILVTRFVSPDGHGEVFDIDAPSFTLMRTINLANSTIVDNADSGRGIPNYISSIVISPDGVDAWVPSKQDNMDRGTFRDGQVRPLRMTILCAR